MKLFILITILMVLLSGKEGAPSLGIRIESGKLII